MKSFNISNLIREVSNSIEGYFALIGAFLSIVGIFTNNVLIGEAIFYLFMMVIAFLLNLRVRKLQSGKYEKFIYPLLLIVLGLTGIVIGKTILYLYFVACVTFIVRNGQVDDPIINKKSIQLVIVFSILALVSPVSLIVAGLLACFYEIFINK